MAGLNKSWVQVTTSPRFGMAPRIL